MKFQRSNQSIYSLLEGEGLAKRLQNYVMKVRNGKKVYCTKEYPYLSFSTVAAWPISISQYKPK